MKTSTGLVAAAILAATLSSCSIGGTGSPSDIRRPGTEVSPTPAHQPVPDDPPCRKPPVCPR